MGQPAGPPPSAGPPAPGCVRHPDRPTRLSCARCGRPACPECLREASVGYQCVDCAGAGRTERRGTTIAGAQPRTGRPLTVFALIAVNVLVYAVTVVQSGSVTGNAGAALFRDWLLSPLLVADGQWWRLLTAGFLHFGPLHLLLNMFSLWVLGRDLEPVLGRGRFLAVYLVSLLGGSTAVMLLSGADSLVAGASGAVFGLMGGLLVVLRRLRIPAGPLIGLIVLNVVLSFSLSFLSWQGHLGGLVVGALATLGLVYVPRQRRTAWQVGTLGLLTVVLVGLVAAGAALA